MRGFLEDWEIVAFRGLCELLDLVVQHQYKGTTHASDHIGPGALEEGF